MRGIRVERPGVWNLVELPEPTPGPGEVVVQVGACGICGSDLHILAGEFPPTPFPIVTGHEFSGTIVSVGSAVANLGEGERVAVDPSLFCGSCDYCRQYRGNLCDQWGAIGDTVDGAFAEFVRVPSRNAYRMPDTMSFGAGALVEPVSCAVHALDRLGVLLGQSVLIYGAGTMGLILAQLLRAAGSSPIVLCDINAQRLETARQFGFEQSGASFDNVRSIAPRGFDIVIEATGVTKVAEAAFDAVGKGGRLMMFGVTPADERALFSPFRVYNQEITVIGSMAVLASYGRALDLVAAGAINAERMITFPVGLSGFGAALERVRKGVGLKTQIVPSLT